MPLFNFHKNIAALVMSGEVTETIRTPRLVPLSIGDRVHLFTGIKTKNCRRLGLGILTKTNKIKLAPTYILIDGEYADPHLAFNVAKNVGFSTWNDFVTFCRKHYGLPFDGTYYQWRLEKSEEMVSVFQRDERPQDDCLKDMGFSYEYETSTKLHAQGISSCFIEDSGLEHWEITFKARPTWVQKKELMRLIEHITKPS